MHRLTASPVLLMFLFASCTKTVVVPVDDGFQPLKGDRYRVTLKDERVFETKNLTLEPDNTITFTCLRKEYQFPLEDVATVERIEVDSGKTAATVAVLAVLVAVGLYALLQDIADAFPDN